jgi:hypothetical protein
MPYRYPAQEPSALRRYDWSILIKIRLIVAEMPPNGRTTVPVATPP